MKKITFTVYCFLIFSIFTNAQTFSTGNIILSSTSGLEYSAQIDITASGVTLTLIGPSDRWLGLGFGVNSMTANGDIVFFDGTSLTDRTFQGVGATPTLDSNQDWSISSNTILSGKRTLVATRNLNTGEANDYVFSTTDTSINLVWARGNGATFTLAYHGFSNKGITSSSITLGVDDFELANNFKIIPNPASSEINLKLSKAFDTGYVKVYNPLGKEVYNKVVSNFDTSIDVSGWSNGIYLISIKTGDELQTKRFIKQ